MRGDPAEAMAVRPVLRLGDPRLRQRSREVAPAELGSAGLADLLTDLRDTMAARDGAGLAAPQIGVPLRLVLFGFQRNPRYPEAGPIPETVLINPRITPLDADGAGAADREGCLSVPGLRAPVRRPQRIHYCGLSETGSWVERCVAGFHARVVQHECDHLDGVLFPDRAELPRELPLPLPLDLGHPVFSALLPPPRAGGRRLLLPAGWQGLGPLQAPAPLHRFAAAIASRLAVAGLDPEPAERAIDQLQAAGWLIVAQGDLQPLGPAGGPLGRWYAALLERFGRLLVQEGWWLEAELTAARAALLEAQHGAPQQPPPTVRGPELLWIEAHPGPGGTALPAGLHPYALP